MNIGRFLPELVKNGHSVSALVVHHGGASPNAEHLKRCGVQVFTQSWHSTTATKVQWILRSLQKIETDFFIPNISVAGWYAARWVRASGIPTIATYRGDNAFHTALVDKFVCGDPQWAVSGLVCVSESLSRRVLERRPASTDVCVIPSGVPLNPMKATFQSPIRIAYVGRIQDEQKQVTKTLEALVECVKQGIQVANVTFFGEGPQSCELKKRVAELGKRDIFNFAGYVAPERIQEKLAGYQALVLLSDYEGIPGAVMDAMAVGVVPICSRLPGIEELVIEGKTGLLVDDREDSFLQAVEKLANNRALWQSLSDSAVNHVRENYSLNICTHRWEEFADRLLQHSGKRQKIAIPRHLQLPPVHPEFAREDFRVQDPRFYLRQIRDRGRAIKDYLKTSIVGDQTVDFT